MVPAAYQSATWRNATPIDPASKKIGIGFDLEEGRVTRLCLSVEDALRLWDTLGESLSAHFTSSQSERSSGILREPGSTPQEGQ